jgi:nitrite reductase (NO-forming)
VSGAALLLAGGIFAGFAGSAPATGSAQTTAPAPVLAQRLPAPQMAAAIGQREPAVVPISLEAKEVVGAIDDGVPYAYWTFDGTVPGPMLRVRQGDTVELTLHNAKDSMAPHSIDLHSVTGPGGGAKVTQITPGESATFRWAALNPGVYVYHCATPPVPQHVANGMYGLIVVEPPEGLPPVDREFYVMQGDFYLLPELASNGVRPFGWERMVDERPNYVVFNGAKDALMGERALEARVGEKIRIFFGVGGPNITSSFHLIGEIFDRVAMEGATEWATNVQTTLVPSGGATIVEFTAEVPGDYVLVDHSLGRLTKGAAGVLKVSGPENAAVFSVVAPAPPVAGLHDPLH